MLKSRTNSHLASLRLEVSYVSPYAISPYEKAARKHSREQIRKLARNIEEFGFVVPILVDKDGTIIAGHARLEAAKRLELAEVPTVRIDHLSPAQIKALRLADNRLAEDASWDQAALKIEFEEIILEDPELELETTGFACAEIDIVLANDDQESDGDDVVPDTPKKAVSRRGDLWLLGEHRLLCGDARCGEDLATLMQGAKAQMVITDPPYNVKVGGHVTGSGRHGEFVMASGEMTETQFLRFLEDSLKALSDVSEDGALHYIFMDWRHLCDLITAGAKVYPAAPVNMIVWAKTNGGMGSLYRSQHELIVLFKTGSAPNRNNVALGRHGRYRTNVWTYPGVNTFHKGRQSDLEAHPTVKPVRLIADAILDVTKPGDIVLDSFGGSGTLLLAAHRTNRKARLVELDPIYVDVAIRRYQDLTGTMARLASTGELFSDVQAKRAAAAEQEAA